MNKPKVIVPLDFSNAEEALSVSDKLDPAHCRVKVGKELFTTAGPALVEALRKRGYDVFLDLKFHDIPSTVAGACVAAADLGVWMINVHASGGREMLISAREAIDKQSSKPLLIAVTVLTSLQENDLKETGINASIDEQVSRLAALTQECGLDGVVCSAREVERLRNERGNPFCLVTPGIRPAGSNTDDQKRIMTPAQAILAGSDYLVIGRPITRADDPVQALLAIEKEINEVSEK